MFVDYLKSFENVLANTHASLGNDNVDLDQAFDQLNNHLKVIRKKTYLYLVGNGGSSGIVSHAAIDFLNACGFQAQAITDNSLLTCMANDYGYENVFAQPLKTLIKKQDILFAVSSSGTSKNILNACDAAKEAGSLVVTFSGFGEDNPLRKKGDYNFWVDSREYGQVEIGHSLLLHYISDQISIK